jgi:thiol peroxidase
MPTERNDFFKLGDKFATILGDDVQVGQMAPEFTSMLPGWKPINPLQYFKGKVIILCALPSIDTETCDIETRRFNEEASRLSDDIVIYIVSTDFPFAQKRWCAAAGVERVKLVSDVVDAEFGLKYGVLIKERRYFRRAVFIVDRAGKLTYVNYIPILGQEPDYAEVLEEAQKVL